MESPGSIKPGVHRVPPLTTSGGSGFERQITPADHGNDRDGPRRPIDGTADTTNRRRTATRTPATRRHGFPGK